MSTSPDNAAYQRFCTCSGRMTGYTKLDGVMGVDGEEGDWWVCGKCLLPTYLCYLGMVQRGEAPVIPLRGINVANAVSGSRSARDVQKIRSSSGRKIPILE